MGWIEKQSKHLGIFKKRWIEVYANDKLCSYANKSDVSPTEILDLRNIHKIYKCIIDQKEFLLAYSTEENNIKSRRFRANSAREALEWIEFFMEQIEMNETLTSQSDNDNSPLQQKPDNFRNANEDGDENSNLQATCIKGKKSSYVPHVGSVNRTLSLDKFIEEIAIDLRQNHHYLAVILEDQNE